jgi:GT2 family glycosyltransferase
MARGDIILFLDDDMELEAGCLRELMSVYEDPRVGGVSAAVVNYERPGPAFLWWSRTFMLGVFKDDRQPVYWAARERRGGQAVVVSRFGGGSMSFRAAVVGATRFDGSVGGVCPGEDVDFCQRLAPGTKLVIAPSARVAHRYAEAERDHGRNRLKEFVQGNHYVYRRNWQGSLYNRLCFLWFNVGCVIWAGVSAMVRLNGEAWRVTYAGMREAGRITADREERD